MGSGFAARRIRRSRARRRADGPRSGKLFRVDVSASERLLSVIDSSDAVLAEDGDSPDPVASRRVAEALVRKGKALRRWGRFEDAVAVWNDLVLRFDEEPLSAAPWIALGARLDMARDLNRVGRYGAAIEAASVLLELCESPDQTEVARLTIARALGVKAHALVSLGRVAEALACDEETISRFGQARETEFRYWAALALEHEAWVLIREGRVDDAVAVSQRLADRLADESAESLPMVAEIISEHVMVLISVSRSGLSGVLGFLLAVLINASGEAMKAAAAAIVRPIPGSRRVPRVSQSIIPQSLEQRRLRARQVLYVNRALLARIGNTDDPDLRQFGAMAEFCAAVGLVFLGHLRAGFGAINRITEKTDPDTIQAFKRLAEHYRRGNSVVNQLATVSFLSLRAEMLGDGDPDLTSLAYDESIGSQPEGSSHTGMIRWITNRLRPATKRKPADRAPD